MTHSLQRLGSPGPPQRPLIDWQSPAAGQFPRHQAGLVKAPVPQSPAVQWNRHDDGIAAPFALQRRHVAGHGSRQCDLPAIFQAKRDRPRDFVISYCRTNSIKLWRICQAPAAGFSLGSSQRQSAMLAAAVAQPFQSPPTCGAKASHLLVDFAAARTSRRQRKIEQQISKPPDRAPHCACHHPLSREAARRTSGAVPPELFDRELRSLRRDRAARIGPELVLYDRAFEECLDRLRDIPRHFDRALLLGCPSPDWPSRLSAIVRTLDVADPGALFAERTRGRQVEEDRDDFGIDRYDLCIAIGTLDSVNDLPVALRLVGRSLKRDAPLIGAIAGGNSLPALRAALIEAGRYEGRIFARTHPRIDPGTLAQLLTSADFSMPVVDVDRVRLRYDDLDALVRDLRAMGATSVLAQRPPPMSKSELQRARQAFAARGTGDRSEEILEILHFLAWTK